MRDSAIRNIYPTVISINGDNDATDEEGKKVTLDESLISAEIDKLLLLDAKINKKVEMSYKFDEVSIKPVTVNDVIYNGGFDSALKLDGAKRLIELAGGSEVTFYDIDNKPNVLSIVDANTVILTISAKVQSDFGHLQDLKVLIASKLKVSTVESITW